MTTPPGARKPRVFTPDDPALIPSVQEPETRAAPAPTERADISARVAAPRRTWSIGWGGLLLSALGGLALLAASISLTQFLFVALARDDWIGWAAVTLLAVAGLSALMILLREIAGLARLKRLSSLRRDADTALRNRDLPLERRVAGRLTGLFVGRPEQRWSLARFAEHASDVRDAGDLLRLADREVLAPLDSDARRIIVKSARRVSLVTAMSPLALIDVTYVLVENLRMLRALAGLYGGRPGVAGGLRLGRMVLTHIVATGGLALTDDLVGQFLGQDLLRRLSRRLGEGAFNGAMTARIGTAAIEVCRPLPFLDQPPVRVRDLLGELFRRKGADATAATGAETPPPPTA